ncbi:hypothetical protein IKH83_01760 [Candidatus Saccharibacteria bacterium]|nr:hypothetical protein [Candidatus Saccharibacteria bacterium]
MPNLIDGFMKYRPVAPELHSPAKKIGELLAFELAKNSHFYFFSPDETTSNRFEQIFEVEKRAWALPKEEWDLPESKNGRIIEMLSENVLFSVMTGHLMNGEPAMMGSYEAFFSVAASQILQQIKFIKQCKEANWRKPLPAVNLLSTSTCWRQDHNGFTHQSPALISTLLAVPSNLVNCLFPLDDIAAEAAFNFMTSSENVVNLTTFNKHDEPRYLAREDASKQAKNHGALVMEKYSDTNPDLIMVGAGDLVTNEVVEAIKIINRDMPDVRIRCINLNALSYRAIGTTDDKMTKEEFAELFTPNKPILANFHGYPETLATILGNYAAKGRIRIHGFIEEGSTTTPMEMLRRNSASRYNLAIDVATLYRRPDLVENYQQKLAENHAHAVATGEDIIS